MSPEAGWYADPTDPSAVRWWDGSVWSAQTRPAPRELAMAGASLGIAAAGSHPASPEPAATRAPTPAPAPQPAPAVVSVVSVGGDPTPSNDELVDRSRPGARRATPPTPAPAPPAAPAATAPAAALVAPAVPATPVPATARPRVAPAAPGSTWVDASAASTATPAALGHGFGGGPAAAFGSASTGHGAVPPGFGSAGLGPMHPGTYAPARSWKRPTAIVAAVVLVLGGAAAVAIPKYRDSKAQETAASAPDVLVHSAPRALAGQKKLTVPGLADLGKHLVSDGAGWAWAQAYGTRDTASLYLASDVPLATRPEVVRALTNRAAATSLLTRLSAGFTAAGKGQAVAGTPAEYASPVGGKTWCMPMTVSGVAGGYCLWTSGKEWLQVLSLPGLEQVAAKSTMTSLTQMAATVTQAAPASTLVPKPSST